MKLKPIPFDLTVCKVRSIENIDLKDDFFFIGKTDDEISLVCTTAKVPPDTADRNDGWRAFRIVGVLDFSLVGILSKITASLAKRGIGIFAVSTYNTDYILVKEENIDASLSVLKEDGYEVI